MMNRHKTIILQFAKKNLILIFFILSCILVKAEDFKFQSSLENVSKEGFYKILLTPEIIANLKDDYSDIRIYDSKYNEIPYLLSKESSIRSNSYFKEYKILSNQNIIKPAVNQIIVENALGEAITELFLVIRNSDIEKEITLKGSDDLKKWFIISRQYPALIGFFQDETSKIMSLQFPKSNYKYFMIQMSIKQEEPLQILKVGNYDILQEQGLYSNVPIMYSSQKDSSSNKSSYLAVRFNFNYEISKIEFQITSPEMYLRNFQIFNKIRTKNMMTNELIYENTLSSKRPSIFELSSFRTNELLIVIKNDDNCPLKIKKIIFFQLNIYLTAQLHKEEKYFLRFGNASLQNPEYDLKYFTDVIPANLILIKAGLPENMKPGQQKVITRSFFNSTIMWAVLICIIVFLAFLTLRLTKELKQ